MFLVFMKYLHCNFPLVKQINKNNRQMLENLMVKELYKEFIKSLIKNQACTLRLQKHGKVTFNT